MTELYPRRRRDLPPLLRHHPRRGRSRALHAGRGARGRAHHPRLRHGRDRARHRHVAGFADRRAAALQAGAPILCDARWSPTASRARACRPATRSSARSTIRAVPALARAHRQHPHRGGDGTVARPAGRRGGGDRQRADGAVPSARACSSGRAAAGRASSACRSASSAPPNPRTALAATAGVPFLIVRGPQGRQRDGGRRRQCAGERERNDQPRRSGGAARAGTLYGIGVGPGDVRYLTLRAAGLVRAVDVVAFFAKRGQIGNARRIVAPLMKDGQAEARLEYPVTDEIPAEHPITNRRSLPSIARRPSCWRRCCATASRSA